MAEEVEEMFFIAMYRNSNCIPMQTMRFPSAEVAAVGWRVMLVIGSSISKDWEIIIVALPILVFQ